MNDNDEPMTYWQLHRRLALVCYAEGVAVARGLRDGTLRQPPGPLNTAADAAELAVASAVVRGWEAPPDVVALAAGGATS